MAILLGNGDGSFTVGPTMTTGGSATNVTSVAVGDFNTDGKLDLAVTNCKSNTVTILLGNGDGSFTTAASPATGPVPSSIVAADLNGDGKLDLAVTTSNDATILLGNGDGTFTSAASPAMSQGSLAAIGDFNGDGIPDLAVAGGVAGILLGNGDGTFTAGASPQNANEAESLAVADFDGDGLTDLAVSILAGDADTVAALLAETQWATAEADNISPSGQGTHRSELWR